MQKDPRTGIEPRTFLLQGNGATNCATMQPVQISLIVKKGKNITTITDHRRHQFGPRHVQNAAGDIHCHSLKECSATIRRKLISAACIQDLLLSVMTQSSWP
ncbi:hypothetical protein CHARACLAT_033597 [Characodon lateralis]|uniref:Uncharacterized protein n=1 Tax=Characodon lateralis TaxID=208331 RepID=A0ABU7F8U9_9TELE|nr:hypothetical protein [Characodon lateralis]